MDTLEHVIRATPPWREITLTECGIPLAGRAVISRDQFQRKLKTQGQQRASMSTCMTCWSTAARWGDWASSPGQVINRDVNLWNAEKMEQINSELRALAALVVAHEDEFYGYLEGLKSTASLADARAGRNRDRIHAVHPRPL